MMQTSGSLTTAGLFPLLATAHQEGLTGTIAIRPGGSGEPFIVALTHGRPTAAWGGGSGDDPSSTAGVADVFPDLVRTDGDRTFLRAAFVDDGGFEVTTGEARVADSAHLSDEMAAYVQEQVKETEEHPAFALVRSPDSGSRRHPMPLEGVIPDGQGVSEVMAGARAERFTGTVVFRPRYSSFPWMVALKHGRLVAAWGGGPDPHPDATTDDLKKIGDPDRQGDRVALRLLNFSLGSFEMTPGEPEPPGSAHLSRKLRLVLGASVAATPWDPRRLASPGTASGPSRDQGHEALSGVFDLDVYAILAAAHSGRFTGTMMIRARTSHLPFFLALADGELTDAWGGDEDEDPSATTAWIEDEGWPGTAGDRVFARVVHQVSGTCEVTPGAPVAPGATQVSREAAGFLELAAQVAERTGSRPRPPTPQTPDVHERRAVLTLFLCLAGIVLGAGLLLAIFIFLISLA